MHALGGVGHKAGNTTQNAASLANAPVSPSPSSDNPMLATIAVADAQLSALQRQADAWLANAQARMSVAREASDFGALVDTLSKDASEGGMSRTLPSSLQDFAVRHGLLSAHAARAPFDVAGLQALGARLQSLAMNDGASSTSEQIQLKRFVTRYDNTLTLYNAVISRLGEMMKRLVSSL
ncbi:hypothetical protein UC34_23405 [Pandoraea vervacti]|uniref:Uncharacterized protein n=1 Tax=Pandoraea vervacti TaxID=656178 RepID=A0ABM5T2K9_9BURK|nr:hypothetical protein UC34_23405 [Pandoraea vervacti]